MEYIAVFLDFLPPTKRTEVTRSLSAKQCASSRSSVTACTRWLRAREMRCYSESMIRMGMLLTLFKPCPRLSCRYAIFNHVDKRRQLLLLGQGDTCATMSEPVQGGCAAQKVSIGVFSVHS
jgi:hypothetical protein